MYIEIAENIVHEKIPEVKTIGRNAIYHEFPWRTWWGHGYGAAADSWLSHLATKIEGDETSNEWCESVAGEDYLKIQ